MYHSCISFSLSISTFRRALHSSSCFLLPLLTSLCTQPSGGHYQCLHLYTLLCPTLVDVVSASPIYYMKPFMIEAALALGGYHVAWWIQLLPSVLSLPWHWRPPWQWQVHWCSSLLPPDLLWSAHSPCLHCSLLGHNYVTTIANGPMHVRNSTTSSPNVIGCHDLSALQASGAITRPTLSDMPPSTLPESSMVYPLFSCSVCTPVPARWVSVTPI